MARYVVDASVIVKWFVEEEYSDKALLLERSYVEGSIDIVVPELLYYEVLNALKYSHRFGEDELKEVLKALTDYQFDSRRLVGEVGEKAVELAMRKGLTIYDAAYAAIALVEKIYLWTADDKLVRKLESLRIVKHIREY
ncbi:MAG: type II toxin-antitoxin system VapC family toxin [Candidatus Njordarchaeales archaeon]